MLPAYPQHSVRRRRRCVRKQAHRRDTAAAFRFSPDATVRTTDFFRPRRAEGRLSLAGRFAGVGKRSCRGRRAAVTYKRNQRGSVRRPIGRADLFRGKMAMNTHSIRPDRGRQRVFYAAGPGDVVGTFRYWRKGVDDPSQVSVPFSGQFFDVCRDLHCTACVISSNPRRETLVDGAFYVENRPLFLQGRGWRYHAGQLLRAVGLMWHAIAIRAQWAFLADCEHWWAFAPLRWFGVRVVPILHNTFWPAGYRPTGFKERLIQWLNGWFWRHVPDGTLCVSCECERQVRCLAGRPRGNMLLGLSHYRAVTFSGIAPPQWDQRPFRVMFAGRVERYKGVFQLLDIAELAGSRVPGGLVIEVCGTGSAEAALRDAVAARGLGRIVLLSGNLDRAQMREAYARSHVVIAPTTAAFNEGLTQVVIEGVLAGRPVVATRVCNAGDLLGSAIIEVPEEDASAAVEAIVSLASDRALYESKRRSCSQCANLFYDEESSWGRAVRRILTKPGRNLYHCARADDRSRAESGAGTTGPLQR